MFQVGPRLALPHRDVRKAGTQGSSSEQGIPAPPRAYPLDSRSDATSTVGGPYREGCRNRGPITQPGGSLTVTVTLRKPDRTSLVSCSFGASGSCDFDPTSFASAGSICWTSTLAVWPQVFSGHALDDGNRTRSMALK